MIKSSPTFFRKAMGYRGRTEHTGRGVYELHVDDPVSVADIHARFNEVVTEWKRKGMVEEDATSYGHRVVVLNADLFEDPVYRRFMVHPHGLGLCVMY